jgi:hypothetical protein
MSLNKQPLILGGNTIKVMIFLRNIDQNMVLCVKGFLNEFPLEMLTQI